MDAIATQKKDGTAQSFGLTFHQQDKVRQNLAQRRVLRDQFEDSTLAGSKEFLFFRFGDIPADNDTAYNFAIGCAQRPAVDPRPKPPRKLGSPDEHFDTVRLLASNCPR